MVGPGIFLMALVVGLIAWSVLTALHRRGEPPPPEAPDGATFARPTPRGRQRIRRIAAVAAAAVALLYMSFSPFVRRAEADVVLPDNTSLGAFLNLAVIYLIGAVLLAIVDLRPLWLVGSLLQGVVLAMFVLSVSGPADGPPKDRSALSALADADVPALLWAVPISLLQVVLLALLVYLAATPTGRQPASSPGRVRRAAPQP